MDHLISNRSILILLVSCLGVTIGCGKTTSRPPLQQRGSDSAGTAPDSKAMEMLGELMVTDAEGDKRAIRDFSDGKNLVVVISRGYYGMVCPYCSAQVQRLATEYDRIAAAGGHVLVIFPIEKISDMTHRSELVEAAKYGLADAKAKLPFQIVSDLELETVDQLKIRDQLSKPATYILDTAGKVRYAHVGNDPGDRPKVTSIIRQLESIQDASGPTTSEQG